MTALFCAFWATVAQGVWPIYAQSVEPIAAIQSEMSNDDDSARAGETVTVQGVVTAVYGNLYFLQDDEAAWSGISIYAPGHTVAAGNEVRVTGVVAEYFDLTQIEPVSTEILVADAPVPSPAPVTVQEIKREAWEGVLVRIDNVTVSAAPNQYGEWRVGDGTADIIVDDRGVFYDAVPGETITTLVGIVDHAFGSYRLLPRTIEDIITEEQRTLQPDELTPIYIIQGSGISTPLDGERVNTVGVVTGVGVDGFFLQDPLGDGNAATSDAIFVYTADAPTVSTGECVLVRMGLVIEFYGKTELSRIQSAESSDLCAEAEIAPVELALPGIAADQQALYEALEGMLVALPPVDTVVQGPTKRFADGSTEIGLVAAELAPYLPGGRVFQGEEQHVAALFFLTGQLGALLPSVAWGDRLAISGAAINSADLAPVLGILDYNFGKYQLALVPDQTLAVTAMKAVRDRVDAAAEDEFTVCTFNLLRMGRGSAQFPDEEIYNVQLRHRARVIAEDLRGCTIVGLQETGTPEDAQALADVLAEEFALDYTAVAIPGPNTQSSEFPLTLGLLARSDVVTVVQSTTLQACSPVDYAVIDVDEFCTANTYPIFNRPPLVVDMTVSGPWAEPYPITVIGNHWKSKAGDESINVLRRTLQAQSVADWIAARLEDDPQANVVVLGDLNDFYGSGPVEKLRMGVTPPLIHTYDVLPELERYTYIFNGASQVLDHVLLTPSMRSAFAGIDLLHINADFPTPAPDAEEIANHVSDHDPVQLTLRPAGAGWIGGNVGVPGVLISLRNDDGAGVGVTISNAHGDFRFWGLPPGRYRVDYKPQRGVTVQSPDQLLRVRAGAGLFLQPAVQIEQGVFGVDAVLLGGAMMAEEE
ncbi:hypothetical protein GC175_19695 [bacterium]|nr:hypothetical protein [bacterium]